MTQWTPKLEKLISEAGEAMDKQMKDFVNPKASVLGTGLRTVFRTGTQVNPAIKKACKEAGIAHTGNVTVDAKKLADVAEQNGSQAADKIKKWLPVGEDIINQYTPSLRGIGKQIKFAKQKYGH